jgi:hypothetical protein
MGDDRLAAHAVAFIATKQGPRRVCQIPERTGSSLFCTTPTGET